MELLEYTRRLYHLTGRLNLYISSLQYEKNKPDVDRLKKEIRHISQIIETIKIETASI